MNSISYEDLKDWYLDNPEDVETAKKYFGDKQPNFFRTGFYSAPSWNWGYEMGIVGVAGTGSDHDGNGIQSGTTEYFEVVTKFGIVKAARQIYIPVMKEDN